MHREKLSTGAIVTALDRTMPWPNRSAALTWVPSSHPRTMRVGIDWDVMRLPLALGERVLTRLGLRSGAVIEDRNEHCLAWLIVPRSTRHWPSMPLVQVLGVGGQVVIPPRATAVGDRVRWRVLPSHRRQTTPAELLRDVLAAEGVR